jgi:hypothetical protein
MTRGLHSKASLEFTCRRRRFRRRSPRTAVTTAHKTRDAGVLDSQQRPLLASPHMGDAFVDDHLR